MSGREGSARRGEKNVSFDKYAKGPTAKGAVARPGAAHGTAPVPAPGLPTPAWVAICVAVLVAGVLAGHYLLGGAGGGVALDGRTTLSASEVGSTIATYTYEGRTTSVTASEVIEESGMVADEGGNYDVPSASDVLSYVQNKILLAEAEDMGLSVTDEELSEYALSMIGSDDYASIGDSYGIDEDTVVATLRQSALVSKLRDAVVTTALPEAPTAPTEPAEGEEDVATAEYASYLLALLGDEWDSENNAWATTDGTYYSTLSGYEFTSDSATYAAAYAAYSVAETAYESASTARQEEWSTYTDTVLSRATIQLGSLAE